MFESVLQGFVQNPAEIQRRPDGIAFLRVAKSIYPGLCRLSYLALNVPLGRKGFLHCVYTDDGVEYCHSLKPLDAEELDNSEGVLQERESNSAEDTFVIKLRSLFGETAFFGVECTPADSATVTPNVIARDFQVLANYFHQHILRIYGNDAEKHLLVSARELDCLKWIAEGKTAWEASVILGISERTVRFHLNSAREKMQCVTTTQAVAKAVSSNLIDMRTV